MPKAGMEMVSGSIQQWLVDDGSEVREGQALYVLETGKVEMEIPSPVSGVVTRVGVVGVEYSVGDVVAVIE